jgi:peptide/nickel transport system substrate-binding protein
VGTGPYKVVEIVGGSQVRLEAAYRNHWLHGAAKYKNLVFKLVPEELTRIGMIKTGEADVARINADRVEGLKRSGFKVNEDPTAHIPFIAFAEQWRKEYPVSNPKVRQALALAVNREEILKHIFYGMGRLSSSICVAKNAVGDIGLPVYPYDPQKAKQLLKEAGYPNGFKIKLHSFQTEMFPSLPRTMETVAAYFQQVGVQPEIIPYADYVSFRPKYVGNELEGGIHANDTQARNFPLRPMYLWYNSASRFTLIKSPQVDEWINKAQSAMDEKECESLILKINKYTHENYTFLFALERSIPYVLSKKVEPWDMGTLVMDINMENVLMWNSPK